MPTAILEIVNKVLTGLGWFFNPKATKERQLKKLRTELKEVTNAREKARREGNNDLYMEKEAERNEILKEIGRVSRR